VCVWDVCSKMGDSEKCYSLWGLYLKDNIFGGGTWQATQFLHRSN
jgi:hypothetical protein